MSSIHSSFLHIFFIFGSHPFNFDPTHPICVSSLATLLSGKTGRAHRPTPGYILNSAHYLGLFTLRNIALFIDSLCAKTVIWKYGQPSSLSHPSFCTSNISHRNERHWKVHQHYFDSSSVTGTSKLVCEEFQPSNCICKYSFIETWSCRLTHPSTHSLTACGCSCLHAILLVEWLGETV